MPNGVKTRFAGLLRELLRRFDENETGAGASQPPRPVEQAAPPPTAPMPPIVSPVTRPPRPLAPAAPAKPASEMLDDLELPLSLVLANLPPQLHGRLTLPSSDVSRASIAISIGKILPQLALGVVKISFGELRQAAPTLFNVDEQYDSLPVVLPLKEVLARLSPNSLTRNPAQKPLVVPEEITGPFNGKGEGLSISTTPVKPSPPPAPPLRVTPASSSSPKAVPPPVAPPPPAFVSRSITPEPRISTLSGNGNGNRNGAPVRPMMPAIPFQPTATKPAEPVAPKPPPAPESATLLAPLAVLAESWPGELRKEIAHLTSANAQVALPATLVEPALKRGRVTFAWRDLRSWIKPTPMAVSMHDGLELELPLKVVAPLFLARLGGGLKMAKPRRAESLPAEIPNLFFGFPQPQPPSEAPEPFAKAPAPAVDETRFATKPAETQRTDSNFYTWLEPDTTRTASRPAETEFKPATEFKRETVPATDFSSRFTPPKEVVARAMSLPGVTGALVALPDGLMVASQIPPALNADTLAAFLPQIYSRVGQCTKQLRMGELNNLNFTVGNVPWKIFRIHGVYFAAFGRAGEQMPTAQLARLAGELDHKKPQ